MCALYFARGPSARVRFAGAAGGPYDRPAMTLRIVHVVADDRRSGVSRWVLVRGLARTLAQRDHGSAIVQADQPATCEDYGLGPRPGPTPDALRGMDAIHLHGWGPTLRPWARAAKAAGLRLVLSPAGGLSPRRFDRPSLGERLRRWFNDPGLLKDATLLAQNEIEAAELRRVGPAVEVLGYGIDFEPPADDSEPAGGPLLLVLGPVHPGWGLVPLLKALAELGPQAGNWRLVLAGPAVGSWKRMIQAAVHRKQAADRVQFEDPDEAGVRTLLRQATLLVAPAVEVVPPTPVLLGVAAGVCVVASPQITPAALGGVVEACEPRRSALRGRLQELLALPVDELRRRGQATRQRAEACCAWSRVVERYERVYAERR